MPNTKPFVQLAAVCELVLQEKDGVSSAIRIVDTITTEVPPSLPENFKPTISFSVAVFLKSGDLKGKSQVSLKLRRPSGKGTDVGSWEVLMNGGEHGANIVAKVQLHVNEFGVFWFDVYWNGDLLTSIPLKLLQNSAAPELGTSSP